MTRRVRYQVATSLDGFIATPNGGYDWIVQDAAVDFGALFKQFDTAVMGRKTYDVMRSQGGSGAMPGIEAIVFSRTLPASAQKGIRVVNDDPRATVAALKQQRGKDIWLFGGGELFRTLLDAGLVDTVELAVMPVLLGSGIPVLPPGTSANLVLHEHQHLPKSGILMLAYSVAGRTGPAPRIEHVKKGKPVSRKKAATRGNATKRRSAKPKPRARKR